MGQNQSDQNLVLLDGVTKGNFQKVKEALEKGADSNTLYHGVPILNYSISQDNTEIAKLLIEHAAGIDSEDCLLKTPLNHAVYAGNVEIVQALINKHVDIDHEDSTGKSPLAVAVIKRDSAMVKLLVENGAHIRHSRVEDLVTVSNILQRTVYTDIKERHLLEYLRQHNTSLVYEEKKVITVSFLQDFKQLQEDCSICQKKDEETAAFLTCGHGFHTGCIGTWIIKNRSCPLCRKKIVFSEE